MAEVSALRLIIIAGASFSEVITWEIDNVLVPLPSGTTAEAKVRPQLYSDEVLVRFSTSPGVDDGTIVLTDPGVTTLSLTPSQTALLAPITDAVFDIKYTFTGGQVIVKLDNGHGLVDIRSASTRP